MSDHNKERAVFDGMTFAEWWDDMQCGGENTYMKLSTWQAIKIIVAGWWRRGGNGEGPC